MKNRKTKAGEYIEKYSNIPRDYNERLHYMVDKYHPSPKMMDAIINRKDNMMNNLSTDRYLLVLYEEPEGTPRHRYRVINKSNYMRAAQSNPTFVQVYQPGAHDDRQFMKRLLGTELRDLELYVQTPCIITINAYFHFPSNYNTSDRFIAEYGLDWSIKKPDWDNMGKKYCDMYNQNIWLDDKLVFGGKVYKYYSELPRVEIEIEYLNIAHNRQTYDSIVKSTYYNRNNPISYLDRNGDIIR